MDALGGANLMMGAAQMGVGIYGGQQLKKANKKITKIDDRMRARSHAIVQRDLGRSQADVNRGAFSAKEQVSANASDRGISDSSIPIAATQRVEDDRARRYTALQDQRNDLAMQWADEGMKRDIQRKSAKLQANLQLIDSAIQGGASGAAAYYGGGNV